MREKLKSILFVFALALVIVGAAKVTEAAAADEYSITYPTETVAVKAVSGGAYYQVIKADDVEAVKASAWIPAAYNSADTSYPYVIDFSALSNTKDSYIAIAGSADAEKAAYVIPVVAKVKSIKATLNYKKENIGGSDDIYDVIAKLEVKPVAKDADDLVWNIGDEKALEKFVTLGWKRGANGAWTGATAFKDVDWKMMKNSNTTLYLRVEKMDETGDSPADIRFSKEAKVKIPKTAKAPTVKIDYKKGTVAIKNGMEFRVPGGEWIPIGVKVKATEAVSGGSVSAEYINKASTTSSVSSLTMEDFKKALGDKYRATTELTLEVRTSATDKKFMSYSTTVKFTTPAAALTSLTTTAAEIRTVTGGVVKFDFKKLATELKDQGYEYAFASADASVKDLKFTALTDTALEFDTTKKFSYKKMVEGKATNTSITYGTIDKLYLRKAGLYKVVKEGDELAFAGDPYVVTFTVK